MEIALTPREVKSVPLEIKRDYEPVDLHVQVVEGVPPVTVELENTATGNVVRRLNAYNATFAAWLPEGTHAIRFANPHDYPIKVLFEIIRLG